MKRILYLVIGILAISTISSCSKYAFMPMEERILGTWEFEQVSYTSRPFTRSTDITHEYRDFQYIFEPSGDFYIYDKFEESEYKGKWTLTVTTAGYEQPETIYNLYLSVYDPVTSSIQQMIWEVQSISSTTFKAIENTDIDQYIYRLVRR